MQQTFSSIEEIADAYRFFAEELVIYTPGNEENWMSYSLYQIHKDNFKLGDNTIRVVVL